MLGQKIFTAGVIFIGLLAVIFVCSPVVSNAKEQLAVMDLTAKYGVDQGLAEALSVEIRDAIHGHGNYEVLSKEDLESLAERTASQQLLGCENNTCLVDFGKKIGTKYMVAGSLAKIGETYLVSLRLIKTIGEDAGVKRRENQRCKCEVDELLNVVRAVASMVMSKEEAVAAAAAPKALAAAPKAPKKPVYDPSVLGRDGDLIAYKNGAVLDTKTNLMWAATDNGKNIDRMGAKIYCGKYTGGGFTDWRLPSYKELKSLAAASKYDPVTGRHLTTFINLSLPSIWSATASTRLYMDTYYYYNFRYSASSSSRNFTKKNDEYIGIRALPVRTAAP